VSSDAAALPAITLVAAVGRNGIIGRDGGLAWRDVQDMQHFRALTWGHPVLMGRRTWDSLPPKFRPLPGRRNLVLTRDAQWQADGAERVASLDDALQASAGAPLLFVIGGAQVYALALPRAQGLELTEVDADLAGDVAFPRWPRDAFVASAGSAPLADADGRTFRFVSYRRRA
jgi:dihydrofolate reductase